MSSPDQTQPARRRLSVAMIVRDAADVVAGSLQSIRAIADEIVVVDADSSDDTRLAAAPYVTKLLGTSWDYDFSDVRNYAWDNVTGDWILWLDAGEQLSPESAAALRKFIDEEADLCKAYMMVVELPAVEGAVCGEQVARLKLVPNYPSLRFEGRVREQLRPAAEAAGLAIDGLPWRISRTLRDCKQEVKIAKARRNLHLAELEIQEHGEQPRLLVVQGEALAVLGQTEPAADCFHRALAIAERGTTAMLEAYYGLLTTCDSDPASRESQMVWCLEALEVFPYDAQLLCAMGGYLQTQGQLELAARAFRTAIEYGKINPETWHLSHIGEVVAACLGLILQLEGKDDEAVRVLEEAIARPDASHRLRRHLIDLHIKHDRRKEAIEQVNLLPAENDDRENLRMVVRGACLASSQNWTAAISYLKAAHTAGCRDPLCLRWFAVTLMSMGEMAAAEPILHQWRQHEPRNVEVRRYLDALASGLVDEGPESARLRLDSSQKVVPNFAPCHLPHNLSAALPDALV